MRAPASPASDFAADVLCAAASEEPSVIANAKTGMTTAIDLQVNIGCMNTGGDGIIPDYAADGD